MEKFTASEVTTLEQVRNWCENHERFETPNTLGEICAVLGAAITTRDAVLEAQERVVPVAKWVQARDGNYPVLSWRKDYTATIGDEFYTHPAPADAERLAEALRLCMDAMLEKGLPTHPDADARVAYTAAEEALVAQTQPPARTCSDERPCVNCFADQGGCLGPAPETVRQRKEQRAVEIAAAISTRHEFSRHESPLILDIVRATLTAQETKA